GFFDGGVLEISTGGDFQDLGPKILRGAYTGKISTYGGGRRKPLGDRQTWGRGRVGAVQQGGVDPSRFGGKTVTIRFRFGSDQSGAGGGWYIDDVRLNGNLVSCSPVP